MNTRAASLIAFDGPDAARFCHAQFSSSVLQLEPGRWHWSAWLTPQGRVRASFPVLRADEQRVLVLPPLPLAAGIAESLKAFVLRMRVQIEQIPTTVHWRVLPDTHRILEVGTDWIGDVDGAGLGLAWGEALPGVAVSDELVSLRMIQAGLPWLEPEMTERYTGHMLGLDRIGALALDKGCYPGQEIVARTHYLGRSPRVLRKVLGLGIPCDPIGLPTKLLDTRTNEAVGELLCLAQASPGQRMHGLAVLREDCSELLRLDGQPHRQFTVSALPAWGARPDI